MEAGQGYPRCEIEVRGHRLKVHLNTMLSSNPPGYDPSRLLVLPARKLIVRLLCCGRWGKPFRARGGYWTPGECAVCHRRKTERFTFVELKPLLPAEWWQETG
jgi:hypothetical protein